jgi:hypothetical protein
VSDEVALRAQKDVQRMIGLVLERFFDKDLAWADAEAVVCQDVEVVVDRLGKKVTVRQVHPGQTELACGRRRRRRRQPRLLLLTLDDGEQEVAVSRVEEVFVDERSWSDQPDDATFDVEVDAVRPEDLELFAESDGAVFFADEATDGMVEHREREAGKCVVAASKVFRGEYYVEQLCNFFGLVKIGLVLPS